MDNEEKGGQEMRRKALIKAAIVIVIMFAINIFGTVTFAVDSLKSKLPVDTLKNESVANPIVKPVFWDLGVLKICVRGQCYYPATDTGPKYVTVPINVHTVSIDCWATYKAPGSASITKADAAYWGSGKFSYVVDLAAENLNYSPPSDCGSVCRTHDRATLTIPAFSYETAQTWSPVGTYFNSLISANIRFLFTEKDVGKTFIPFCYVYPVGWKEGGPDLSNQGVRYPRIRVGEGSPFPKPIKDAKSTTKVK